MIVPSNNKVNREEGIYKHTHTHTHIERERERDLISYSPVLIYPTHQKVELEMIPLHVINALNVNALITCTTFFAAT